MNILVVGFGRPATGITPVGALQAGEGEEPVPFALFEPARAVITQAPGQPPREMQVEGTVTLGPHR